MPCAETLRVQAWFDGELDAPAAVEIEAHCATCPECRALSEELRALRKTLREQFGAVGAPAELRARIARALDQEDAAPHARQPAPSPGSSVPRSFWTGVLSGIGASALAAGLAFFLLAPAANPLLDELVSAHVRSLMPDHLIDVESTDKHTVKPWFAGHADVSPVVADFSPQGYRLIGGRADYFDRQRAAVVVYRHGAHLINVFSWASDQRAAPKDATRNGYHLAFWKSGNLVYCAVSDTSWDELRGLVTLLRDNSSQDLE